MGKLFGTDGIRGKANNEPITVERAMKIGQAVAYFFKGAKTSNIVVGKDTRLSGDMLESALVAGICSMGVNTILTGILPTPGIAYITASTKAKAGIVISASHNPFFDNGIKIFQQDGFKLTDKDENQLEELILGDKIDSLYESIEDVGKVYLLDDSKIRYSEFLKKAVAKDCSLKGMKIVLDCANGATFQVAPKLLKDLGAQVTALFVSPDGKNINDLCGSEHPEKLTKKVLDTQADMGLAFDGDGDRLVAVDELGNVVRGDQIIAICAKVMKEKEILQNNGVVSTVMSNLGLTSALNDLNVDHIVSDIGDRRVVEKMIATDTILGGEDSGHIIFLKHHTTGDGLMTALKLLESINIEAKALSFLRKIITLYPQECISVEVKNKPPLSEIEPLQDIIKSVEKKLGQKGRVLVRYSGTEPKCRVMVEGPDLDETRSLCQLIANVISSTSL